MALVAVQGVEVYVDRHILTCFPIAHFAYSFWRKYNGTSLLLCGGVLKTMNHLSIQWSLMGRKMHHTIEICGMLLYGMSSIQGTVNNVYLCSLVTFSILISL